MVTQEEYNIIYGNTDEFLFGFYDSSLFSWFQVAAINHCHRKLRRTTLTKSILRIQVIITSFQAWV